MKTKKSLLKIKQKSNTVIKLFTEDNERKLQRATLSSPKVQVKEYYKANEYTVDVLRFEYLSQRVLCDAGKNGCGPNTSIECKIQHRKS